MLENDTTKLKFHSWKNQEQMQFGEYLLLFNSESYVFSSAIYKPNDSNIGTYNLSAVLYGYETWSLTFGGRT
jgi:hypothetical protein